MADNNKLTIPEFRQKLAKGLKDQIEAFGKTCEELKAKEAEGTLKKSSPPGKAKEVEDLKAKGTPKDEAFAISWKQYEEKKKKKALQKDDMGGADMGDMSMAEDSMDKKEMSATSKARKFPSLADEPEDDGSDKHPSQHAAPNEATKVAKRKDMTKKELGEDAKKWAASPKGSKDAAGPSMGSLGKSATCEKCGKSGDLCKCMNMSAKCEKCGNAPCSCMKKDEDYINPETSNQPQGKKFKRFGGKDTKVAGDTPVKSSGNDEGSGDNKDAGKALKKKDEPANHGADLKPGHSLSLQPVGSLPAPDHSKVQGHVARIHAAAKAKMAKSAPMAAPVLKSEPKMEKNHIGFNKLKGELAHEKGVSDPGAVAAAIGDKKYGKKGMEAKAKAGKAKK